MSSSPTDSNALELIQPPSLARRLILIPLQLLFDAIWHFLAFIVGAVLIGGILVNVVISLATTGSPGITNPETWPISRPILAYPIYALAALGTVTGIGLCSYLVHRRSHGSGKGFSKEVVEEFGLSLVHNAVPTPSMIPFYRSGVYIPRRIKDTRADADSQARAALIASATRSDPSGLEGQYGLCVIGRDLLGTTRLAWEALHAEHALGNWIFVRWPHNAQRYVALWDNLKQYNAKAVFWLDDLSKYRDERNTLLIANLPFALQERRIPFIIVATLPEDGLSTEMQVRLGSMLDHLVQMPLGDLSLSEARMLVADLTRGGDKVTLDDHFDGTPGSIILAVSRMRDEVYPRLSLEAKIILRTIKLLRTAGIREYTLDRVLGISIALFSPHHSDWTSELEALRSAGFLRQVVIDSGRVIMLEPISEVYLDVAVPDYSAPTPPIEEWHRLLETLVARQDASALIRLGNAFRTVDDDNRAETCYRRALDNLTRGTAEQDWASAHFGLGSVLSKRVDAADVVQRRKLLEQAEEAFKNALLVVNRDNDPTFWAEIQGRLAGVVRHEATTTVGPVRRVNMLDAAAASCREALRILRRETSPDEWAEAQHNLGLVLLTHAQFAHDSSTRRRMLDGAIDALTCALSVFTPENSPYNWPRTRRYLGDATRLRSEASNRPKKDNLLEQSIDAYMDAVTAAHAAVLWSPAERAEVLSHLSTSTYQLGILLNNASSNELLARAADAVRASAEAYVSQSMQDPAVNAYRSLSSIQFEQANRANGASRIAFLDEAIQANIQIQTLLGRAGTRELKAQIRLDLARLYWARAMHGDHHASVVVRKDAEATSRYAEQSLDYYERDRSTAEYKLAARLQRDANRKIAALESTQVPVVLVQTGQPSQFEEDDRNMSPPTA